MTLPDYAARLRKSQKFLAWHPSLKPQIVEKYFSPKELADAWGVDTETIRYVFTTESGVVKFDGRVPEPKRSRSTFRIPESVAVRVHRRLSE